jgi:hypothetical protein
VEAARRTLRLAKIVVDRPVVITWLTGWLGLVVGGIVNGFSFPFSLFGRFGVDRLVWRGLLKDFPIV